MKLKLHNMFTALKIYKADFYLKNKIYRNSGVLKDAERFSLIDTVLDGEYNDINYLKSINLKKGKLKKGNLTLSVQTFIKRSTFKFVLLIRFISYYILHFRYKAM
jgi:hypothetical protein